MFPPWKIATNGSVRAVSIDRNRQRLVAAGRAHTAAMRE
jgi:hypothetical protein